MADSVTIKITGDDTDFRKKMDGIGEVTKKGFKIAAAAVAGFAAVSIKQLADLAEETREYREDMAKLEAAFTTAGFTTEQATKAYKDMFAVLGEEDRSVETVNHLAQLCDTQKELDTWTTICTGVLATFGDSLPIEGLTEAANETAKVGKVVGPLADALNWAGVSEDAFNESLAKCSTEQERQALITETLNGLYTDAAKKYNEINAGVMDANRAQSDYTDTLAALGAKVEPIMTALKVGWTHVLGALLDLVKSVDLEAYAEKIVKAIQSFDTKAAINHIANLMKTIKNLLPIILTVVTAMAAWRASLTITTIIKGLTTSIKGCQAAMLLYAQHGQLANIATTGFTAAQKALMVIMGVATGKINLITAAQKALNIAFKANPVGLIITAITVLIGVIVLLWNKCEWFRNAVGAMLDFFKAAFEGLRTALSAIWEAIKAVWDSIIPYLTAFWETVKATFSIALDAIKGFFSAAWGAIKFVWDTVQPYFQALWDAIVLVFSVVAEVLGCFFSLAWGAIKLVWDLVVTYFQNVWNGIVLVFSVVASVLSGFFSAAWKAIKFIWDVVVNYFSNIWTGIKTVFSGVAAKFSEWFTAAKTAVTKVWDTIKSYFSGILKGIADVFTDKENGIVAKFKNWFKEAYEKVKDFFTVDNFKEVFNNSIVGGLGKIVEAVKTKAGDIWNEIKEALKKPITVVLDFLGIGGGEGGGSGSGALSPYSTARISQGFKPGKHNGIDYACKTGTPIQTPVSGRVTTSKDLIKNGKYYSYGRYVVIRDTKGNLHYFAHMSRRKAVAGQPVVRGATIGYVGSTGNSTGPHLHYEVRHGGKQVNPKNFLKGYKTGGFPSPGELFIGNEDGIELMGKMGNKNVIANNMQIIEGIKQGLFSGMVNYAKAKGKAAGNVTNINQEMHFHKENESPSTVKRAAKKGLKLGLAGGY